MVACDYPQCKREWVSTFPVTLSLAILTTSPFIVSSRLRRFDGAAAISNMVLPGLRATGAEGRDFRFKKERAIKMRERFVSRIIMCIDNFGYLLFCNTLFSNVYCLFHRHIGIHYLIREHTLALVPYSYE